MIELQAFLPLYGVVLQEAKKTRQMTFAQVQAASLGDVAVLRHSAREHVVAGFASTTITDQTTAIHEGLKCNC